MFNHRAGCSALAGAPQICTCGAAFRPSGLLPLARTDDGGAPTASRDGAKVALPHRLDRIWRRASKALQS